MLRGSIAKKSIVFQLFLLLLTIVISSFLCVSLGVYVVQLNFHIDELNQFSPEGIQALKLIQIFSAIGVFIIPSFLIRHLLGEETLFVLNQKPAFKEVLLSISLIVIAVPLINILIFLGEFIVLPDFFGALKEFFLRLQDQIQEQMQAFLLMSNLKMLLANLVVVAFLPAIGEELLFRGVIQKLLYRLKKSAHFAIWVSAFLFAILHQQIHTILPIMLIGGMLGYLYYWTNNIWIPILVHFTNNTLSLIIEYFVQHNKINEEVLNFGATPIQIHWVFISLIGTTGLMYLIKRTINLN